MEKEHYLGHRKRLKEKFDEAPSVLSDYEIVELLLGYVITRRDVKPLAKDILKAAGTIGNIFAPDYSSIKGAGPETERFLKAVRELYNRIERSEIISSESISSAEQVYRILKYSLAFSSNERFAVILLNGKNKVSDISVMAEGIVNAAIVYPRQVAEHALKNKAVGVIIAHNHPSGDSSPSKKDIELTRAIHDALSVLGIRLRDHVIVAKDEYTSLFDTGYMKI